jgi:integrase
MGHSIAYSDSRKPPKPYDDFPLYAHKTKRWAKKIKGRTIFFGPWRCDPQHYESDWQEAYARYQHEMPYLVAGKTPPPKDTTSLTVGDLVNSMLEAKDAAVQNGELSPRSWADYKRVGKIVVAQLGRYTTVESLTPSDFAALRAYLAKSRTMVALWSEIGRISVFFRWAEKQGLIDRPVRMGNSFKKPSKKSLRLERQAKPKKLFTIDELRSIFQAANPTMRAFMLLALNGGLGNSDIGRLEPRHIVDGWIIYPRPKTAVERRFPLWPETVAAIEQCGIDPALEFVFMTKYGGTWFKDSADDPITKEFRKLCDKTKCHKENRGFYALRHQFRTTADGCRDRSAVDYIMGHDDGSMSRHYTEHIDDERLQAVVNHVREWVLPMFEEVNQ